MKLIKMIASILSSYLFLSFHPFFNILLFLSSTLAFMLVTTIADVCDMFIIVQAAHICSTTSCLLIPLLTISLLLCVNFFLLSSDTIFFYYFPLFLITFRSVDDLHHYCPISNYSAIACFIGPYRNRAM